MTESITIKSPAKINLFLKVTRKRPDGYHEINTVFQMINLCDCITMRPAGAGIEIICDHKDVPLDKRNLVFKAAESFMDYCGVKKGVRISIDKKIPVAAGLGGGSSNAASALLGLNALWKTGLTNENLFRLARPIGADVPFFLNGPTAFGEGTGDILTPLKPFKKMHIILINPNIPVSAQWAYTNLRLTTEPDVSSMKDYYLSRTKRKRIPDEYIVNDLELPVSKKYSIINEVKQELQSSGGRPVLMSGSGPTVFGIFASLEDARKAHRRLSKTKWSVFITETITDMKEIANS